VKTYSLLAYSLNGESATNLQEMLEVTIASSWAFPQNRLAQTIVISTCLSSKLASPLITLGLVATLAAEGAEKI
jgi:hypothetical protein